MLSSIRSLCRQLRSTRGRHTRQAGLRLEELEARAVPTTGLYYTPYQGPGNVAVSFSPDERNITVQADGRLLNLNRPVVSPWNFQPTGTIYWVDPSGNDQNAGDATHPFATISRGVAAANPGDAVYINPGNYVETVWIAKSGTAGHPIIISCAPGALGKVNLRRPDAALLADPGTGPVNLAGTSNGVNPASYVWVNGLVIQGPLGTPAAASAGSPGNPSYSGPTWGYGWTSESGITLGWGAGWGDRLTNNVVYGNTHCGIKELGHGGTNFLLEGNVLFDNGTSTLDHGIYMPASYVTMNGNIAFNNAGFGIQSYSDPTGQVITRNLSFGNYLGGIVIAGPYNLVEYNTFAYNQLGISYYTGHGTCHDNVVEYNIFDLDSYVDGSYGKDQYYPLQTTDDYNCYGGQVMQYFPLGPHEILADPLFNNPANADFTLSALSTCPTIGAYPGQIVLGTFAVNGFPWSTAAGVAGSFTVTAKNNDGTTATGYTGTVHLTSSDGQAVLPADYTFTAADAGVHTFSATLKTAGAQSITATDTSTTSLKGMELGIIVNPAAASTMSVAGFPSPTTAGVAANLTVTLKDPYGNIAKGYTGTVHFTSSDGLAALPANYTFTAADAGVHIFSATLNTAGTQSITAADTSNASLTASQRAITVNPAGITVMVAGFPSSATAGVAGSFTVTVKNTDGTTATGYTGTVHFTSSDGQAGLPADYTFTAADAGAHIFSATLKTAGTQSITATDTTTATVTGSETGITVNPAAASTLSIAGFPSPTTAGVFGTLTVTLKDSYGNIAKGYTGTVHFTSSDGQAALPANYVFTATDAGVHTFSAALKTAGTQSITATDTTTASITGSQTGITVNPAAASTMVAAGFASPTTAGVTHNLTVTLKDAYGNVAKGYTGTVHFTSSDAKGALPADYTFTASDGGVHTFSAALKTVGTQSITAKDMAAASLTGTDAGNTVNPAAASQFIISAPANVTSGVAFSLTLTVEDAYGNVVTGYTGTVHFTSTDKSGILPMNYTFTAADSGVHIFTGLVLKKKGKISITITDILNSSLTGKVVENVQ